MDLNDAASLLRKEPQTRADASLSEFQLAVGNSFDPGDQSHALAARRWLNKWGCRIAYPRNGEPDRFVDTVADWWSEWRARLPAVELVSLTDENIDVLCAAFENLSERPADRRRRMASTASAKLLFAVRPESVTAWDRAIASRPNANYDFAAHLRDAREIAQDWVAQADGRSIPEFVGRPNSSLAKVVDEILYLHFTRGVDW